MVAAGCFALVVVAAGRPGRAVGVHQALAASASLNVAGWLHCGAVAPRRALRALGSIRLADGPVTAAVARSDAADALARRVADGLIPVAVGVARARWLASVPPRIAGMAGATVRIRRTGMALTDDTARLSRTAVCVRQTLDTSQIRAAPEGTISAAQGAVETGATVPGLAVISARDAQRSGGEHDGPEKSKLWVTHGEPPGEKTHTDGFRAGAQRLKAG
jgi:hypothetical protein